MFTVLIGASLCLLGAKGGDPVPAKARGYESALSVRRKTHLLQGRIQTERCDVYPHLVVVSLHDGDDMGDVVEVRASCTAPAAKPLAADTGYRFRCRARGKP